MKNKGLIITLITILSLLAISLIILMILLINGRIRIPMFGFSDKVSNELIMDKIYENKFTNININASTSDINILVSNDENIRVVIYGEEKRLEVKDETQELYILFEEKKCFGFCFNITKDKIDVYLPANYDKDILVNNNYGNIDIATFKNSNIEVNEDCGDVHIASGNKVTVNNSYGDIKIDEASEIDVKESAGDVKVGTVNVAKIENNLGDIIVESVTSSLDIDDDCGDIKINSLNLEKDSYIVNNLGDIKIGSTNDIYIDAKTDLGKVKINSNNHKADITLKLENDCGDIKVNN